MSGQPSTPLSGPTPGAYQPYGVAQPPAMPAFNPGAAKQPGSTSTKIWGVMLLIFGAMSLLQLVSAAVMMFGGFNGAAFSPGISADAKAEIDRMTHELISASLSRPTFWIHTAGELAVVVLSWLAGVFLLIKPRPKGAKLAVARAALVLLMLPIYGYEQTIATESAMDSQQAIMRAQFAEAEKKGGSKGRKGPTADQLMETMNPIMKGITYGSMVVVVLFVLVINGLLAFQMSRPAVKAYLAGAAAEKVVIPGYDPSMGLIGGMPPAGPPGAAPMPPAGAPPPPAGPPGA